MTTKAEILAAWELCLCGIAECNWSCDWVAINNIINNALFNPGDAPGFLQDDGFGNLSWVQIPLSTFLIYYFQDTASGIAGDKKQLSTTYSPETALSFVGVTDGQLLQSWATDPGVPGITFIPSGDYEVNIHSAQIGGTKNTQLYCKINEVNSSGTFIATIATTGYTSVLTGTNTDHFCTVSIPTGYTLANTSSRIVTEVYAHVTGTGSDPDVEIYYGGASDSRTIIPNINSFAGILGPSQGGTGQDTSASTGIPYVNAGTWSIEGTEAQGDNSTKPASTAFVHANMNNYWLPVYSLLGSSVLTETIPTIMVTGSSALTNQAVHFFITKLPTAKTITGVRWFQVTKGSYTANNNNKIGLYSYSGGTLTLVASCNNDGTLWQTASSGTFGTKNFSSTYAAAAGIYYIAYLWCESAVVTAPVIGAGTAVINANVIASDFTNSAMLFGGIAGQTDLPATQAMSGLSIISNPRYLSLY